MTQLSILGPPRSGRKVLTEKEALEQVKNSVVFEEAIVGRADSGNGGTSAGVAPVKSGVVGLIDSRIEQISQDTFRFFNIPYQGGVLPCVERTMQYLDQGEEKSQKNHLEWLAQPGNNPNNWTIADMELEYQMLRISFGHRFHWGSCPEAIEYINQVQKLFVQWIVTADHIKYLPGGLEAVITNKGSITSKPQKQVLIPEYTDTFFQLSEQRDEKNLHQTNIFDNFTQGFLETFLGQGYENAGAIFPYCASRKDNQLRETRIWTPSSTTRTNCIQMVGGFGILGEGRFDIITNDRPHSRGRAIPVKNILLS